MAKILLVREIPFRIYHKKDGTWQGYCRVSKKHFHRSSMESLRIALDEEAKRLKGDSIGQTLMSAGEWQDYSAARAILEPLKATFYDAAKLYADRSKVVKNPSTFADAADAFERDKTDLSTRYRASIRAIFYHLKKICEGKMVHESGDDMVGWLRKNNARGRGFNIIRGYLITFWRWCQTQGMVERDGATPFEQVSKKKESGEEVTIISPATLEWLFEICNQKARDWIMLSAFYGLRSAEAARLSGADIHMTHDVIEVPALKAKTGQRRLVTFIPEMRPWLATLAQRERVLTYDPQQWVREAIQGEQDAKTRKLKVKPLLAEWPQNVLRHSWISYRLALTGNVDQVAADAGTSRDRVYKNYRALRTMDGLPVTKELAGRWFGVVSGK